MVLNEMLRDNRRLGKYQQSVAQVRNFRHRFKAEEMAEIYILHPKAVEEILKALDAHPDWDDEQIAENVDFN